MHALEPSRSPSLSLCIRLDIVDAVSLSFNVCVCVYVYVCSTSPLSNPEAKNTFTT